MLVEKLLVEVQKSQQDLSQKQIEANNAMEKITKAMGTASERKLEVEKPTRTLDGSKQWAETQWCNTAGALRVALGPVSFTQWWQEMVKSGDEDKIKARLAEWGVTPQVLGSGLALEHAPAY